MIKNVLLVFMQSTVILVRFLMKLDILATVFFSEKYTQMSKFPENPLQWEPNRSTRTDGQT